MIALEQVNSLKEYFQSAESVAVILGQKPTVDQLALASALFIGCQNLNKEVGLYAPKKISDDHFDVLAKLQTELGKQNLVVSFDYNEQAVDKVSYHIGEETKKFHLTIKPKKGAKPLNPESVEFSYAGADVDLIFLIGVHDLETLDQLYFGYESLYENSYVVTLHNFKPEIGATQFDLSGTSSMSETMVDLLQSLGVELNDTIATSLLMGIEQTTNHLQSLTTSAETFEKVAQLLRAGARRIKRQEAPTVALEVKKLKPVRKKRVTTKKVISTTSLSTKTKVGK
ncbi:MAG: DHH family phosphoesterase [Patescibacteria group bacterium]